MTIMLLLESSNPIKFWTPPLNIFIVFFNEVIVLPIVFLILGFIRHVLSSTFNGDTLTVIFITLGAVVVHDLVFLHGATSSVRASDRRWRG